METKELKDMEKPELLEIVEDQTVQIASLENESEEKTEQIQALEKKITELETKVKQRAVEFSDVGSIAEASLKVSNVFAEAQKSADIYLKNVKEIEKRTKQSCEQKREKAQKVLSEAEERAEEILSGADEEAEKIVSEAKEQSDKMLSDAKRQSEETVSEAEEKSEKLLLEAKEKSEKMVANASEDGERIRREADEFAVKREKEADDYYALVRERTKAAVKNLNRFHEDFLSFQEIASAQDSVKMVVMDGERTIETEIEDEDRNIDVEKLYQSEDDLYSDNPE